MTGLDGRRWGVFDPAGRLVEKAWHASTARALASLTKGHTARRLKPDEYAPRTPRGWPSNDNLPKQEVTVDDG